MKNQTPAYAVFLAYALLVMPLQAQELNPFDRPGQPAPQRPQQQMQPQAGNTISNLRIVDAPVTTVFEMVSDLTGWSLFISPEVSKTPPQIDLWVKDLSPDELLSRVAKTAGVVAHRDGDIVHVLSFDEYARDYGVAKELVELEHADANKLATLLGKFTAEKDSKVVISAADSRLVILAPPAQAEALKTLAVSLDVPRAAEKTRMLRLEHVNPDQLVPELKQFFGSSSTPTVAGATTADAASAKSDNLRIMAHSRLNAVVLEGRPSQLERADGLIQSLDVPSSIRTESYALRYTSVTSVYETLSRIVDELRQEGGGGGRGSRSLGQGSTARGLDDQTVSPRLKIAASDQNNRIVVEGSPADHVYVAELISAIDKPLPPGSGGMRVYRLKNASSSEVAEVLRSLIEDRQTSGLALRASDSASSPSTTGAGAPDPQGAAGTATQTPAEDGANASAGSGDVLNAVVSDAPQINAVIVKASAAEHEQLGLIIRELDMPREQVMLEVTLVTVRATDDFEFSVEWGVNDLARESSKVSFTRFGVGAVNPARGDVTISDSPPSGVNFGILNPGDFSVVLNALHAVGDTRISSSPKLLVQDNAEAEINQVNQEPFEQTNLGETTATTSFGGFVDAGTSLTVTPHVADNGVRLTYDVTLSSFGTRSNESLPPPRLQNRLRGTIRVPDGAMIALGGLVASRHQRVTEGVPFLKDIPLLGLAFRRLFKQEVHDTLYVFIKPVVLRDPAFRDLIYITEPDLKKAGVFRGQSPQNDVKVFYPLSALHEGAD